MGDAGWLTCPSRHKLHAIRLWNRIVSLPPDRVVHKIFLWDLLSSNKRSTSSFYIKSIFDCLNKQSFFENITPVDLQDCFNILLDNDILKWNESRYTKPKLRYYNMYKSVYNQENYLNLDISKYQRSLFAQFRAGILPLQVEIGRYRNLELSTRICILCNDNEVEDEYHFLCICSFYSHLRNDMYLYANALYDGFDNLDDLDKFVFLMSNCQLSVIKFIEKAMYIRKQYLYTS